MEMRKWMRNDAFAMRAIIGVARWQRRGHVIGRWVRRREARKAEVERGQAQAGDFEDKGKEEIEKKRKRPDSESGSRTRKQRYKNVVHYIF